MVSLEALSQVPGGVASVTVTVPEAWREAAAAVSGRSCQLAPAGVTRTQSTWNALEVLARQNPDPADLVAVHDAARPFASADLLARLVTAAEENGAAVPGIPVADTIVQKDGKYLDRSRLVAVQTPQVFRWDLLQAAHAWAAAEGAEFTDDGGLLAARGHDPAVVAGEVNNWKVTSEDDWNRAQALLSQ
jgi:2-C-methyl-D-erythritol 4-phosphate cytidylyltransferase/2-C-methyl-D-erythritol 2,4-cyclodiphosphate synthase